MRGRGSRDIGGLDGMQFAHTLNVTNVNEAFDEQVFLAHDSVAFSDFLGERIG